MDEGEGWGSPRKSSATAVLLLLLMWSGTGVVAAQDPVEISNATELQNVCDDLDGDYVLVADIDLSGIENFEPIGNRSEPFTGTFDGDGHTMLNLTIDRPDEDSVGLFGVVEDGVVENVTLTHVEVIGGENVGSLVGTIRGEVRGSDVRGNVTGESAIGGMVGLGYEIHASSADVHVEGDGGVGGLVGSGGDIHDSYATGDVYGNRRAGGLIGSQESGGVFESHAEGDVYGNARVGGLAGQNHMWIRDGIHDSYATGDVAGNSEVGGLVGHNWGEVRGSHAEGEVEGTRRVGGLVGMDKKVRENGSYPIAGSYAEGGVTGRWTVGGLIGVSNSTVNESYAEGDVEGYAEIGGLVGELEGEVRDTHAEGTVQGESRTGVLVGDLNSGSLIDSRWVGGETDFPAVGVRKPNTIFENVEPDTVGESGEDVGRLSASEPGGERWVFDPESDREVLSPTVVDGKAYVGQFSHVYAVNVEDGTEEWEFETEGYPMTPTVAGGVAYVGVRADDNTYALDASTGSVIWTHEGEDPGAFGGGSPFTTVADGKLYMVESSSLVALDASTGEEVWTYENATDILTSPTAVDGSVYTKGDDLHAVNTSTGETEWVFGMEGEWSSPTVADGTVYIGGRGDGERRGVVHAVDATDGTEKWSFETTSVVQSTPTVADGTVYVDGYLGDVYAIDAESGEQEWRHESRGWQSLGPFFSSPTVANGTVYLESDKYLHAVNASTGEEWWRFEVEDMDTLGSPIVVNGTVYMGSDDGKLYAVNAGVSGSSEGSRVLLGTLGHHHTWAEKQAEHIDVDRGLPISALVAGALLVAVLGVAAVLRLRSEEGGE